MLVRNFLGLMVLLCCAMSLAAPSLARGAHFLEHARAPVAVGEFHSHDGEVDAKSSNQDAPTKSGETSQDKFGHSHMPTSVTDLNYSAAQQLGVRWPGREDADAAANTPSLATRGWSPPVRPPRTA